MLTTHGSLLAVVILHNKKTNPNPNSNLNPNYVIINKKYDVVHFSGIPTFTVRVRG